MNLNEPLVWTSRGNMNVSELVHEVLWDNKPSYIKLIERYTASDGVIVREDAHVYSKHGVTGETAIASF